MRGRFFCWELDSVWRPEVLLGAKSEWIYRTGRVYVWWGSPPFSYETFIDLLLASSATVAVLLAPFYREREPWFRSSFPANSLTVCYKF